MTSNSGEEKTLTQQLITNFASFKKKELRDNLG